MASSMVEDIKNDMYFYKSRNFLIEIEWMKIYIVRHNYLKLVHYKLATACVGCCPSSFPTHMSTHPPVTNTWLKLLYSLFSN